MCRRAALCLLVVVWLCAAVCGVDAGSSEAHSGEDERSFDKLWVSTSSAPLNIDARRWLISRMGPQGVIAPGRVSRSQCSSTTRTTPCQHRPTTSW